jgi:preprotein translocase subunit SecG
MLLKFLETPLTVLHICVALFLVLVILIQPGKSGGLGAALGGAGAQQVFGGRGAGNFLSRMTWISAGIFFLTSVLLAYVSSSTEDSLADRRKTQDVEQLDNPVKPESASAAAATTTEPAVTDVNNAAAPIEGVDTPSAAAGDRETDAKDGEPSSDAPAAPAADAKLDTKAAKAVTPPKFAAPKVPQAAAPKTPSAPEVPAAATPKAPEAPKTPAAAKPAEPTAPAVPVTPSPAAP